MWTIVKSLVRWKNYQLCKAGLFLTVESKDAYGMGKVKMKISESRGKSMEQSSR